MTAMGLALAWRTETSAGFHAVMNLVFLPMWLLSGAFFPPSGAAGWLAVVMRLNPLTWCTEAIRGPLMGQTSWLALPLSGAFAVAMLVAATLVVASERDGA
jgi:ABC-2 type transport system permease protein